MGKIAQSQSNAEDPQPNKLAPETEPASKSHPDEAGITGNGHSGNGLIYQPKLNLGQYRKSQNMKAQTGTRKAPTTVPIRKPRPLEWVYIIPSDDWRIQIDLLEDKSNQEVYLVNSDLELGIPLSLKWLVTYQTRKGDPVLWPINVQVPGKRKESYHESYTDIVTEHSGEWIRLEHNEDAKRFDYYPCPARITPPPPPELPQYGLQWVLDLGFKHRTLDSYDHPVLKRILEAWEG
jgi:hypothetical protein